MSSNPYPPAEDPTPEELRAEVAKWPGDAETALRLVRAKYLQDVPGASAAIFDVAESGRWASVLLVMADQLLVALGALDRAGLLESGLDAFLDTAAAEQLEEQMKAQHLDGDAA